jgi:hypothetical protein
MSRHASDPLVGILDRFKALPEEVKGHAIALMQAHHKGGAGAKTATPAKKRTAKQPGTPIGPVAGAAE